MAWIFTDITKSHPYSGGRAGERRECRDQKRAKPERGDHTGHHVNQSRSGTDLLRGQNTLNRKVYFTGITNALIESQCSFKHSGNQIKAGTDVWRCDALPTWVDLRCGDPKQVEEGEEEEVSVPEVLHPKNTHWDRLWIWNTRQTLQVTLVCSATSTTQPRRSRFVFNWTVCIHGNQTFIGIHAHAPRKCDFNCERVFISLNKRRNNCTRTWDFHLFMLLSLSERRSIKPWPWSYSNKSASSDGAALFQLKKKQSDAFSFYNFASWTNCRSKWWLDERWDKWWRRRKKRETPSQQTWLQLDGRSANGSPPAGRAWRNRLNWSLASQRHKEAYTHHSSLLNVYTGTCIVF